MTNSIFFDHNSTTPLLKAVKEAMIEMMDRPLNASSVHSYGRAAKLILENSRKKIINLCCAGDQYRVIFTSCGTESNNLALNSFKGLKVITTTIEHSSVIDVAGAEEGDIVPCLRNGVIDLAVLEQICAQQTGPFLVSIMAANNETGVIQPLKEAAKIVHNYQGFIHSDATQAFGKIPFDIIDLDLDMVTMSGHKFGGPQGAGALIIKKKFDVVPLMKGGGQEFRYRPGTQNLLAIHGFGVAAEHANTLVGQSTEIAQMRDYIEREIMLLSPKSIVFGAESTRLPNTLLITMPEVASELQVIHFDINGFAVSIGAACSSGKADIPRIPMNMGYTYDQAKCALRISLGLDNNLAEIKSFVKVWHALYNNYHNIKKAA